MAITNPAQRGVAKEKARQNLSARFAGACAVAFGAVRRRRGAKTGCRLRSPRKIHRDWWTLAEAARSVKH